MRNDFDSPECFASFFFFLSIDVFVFIIISFSFFFFLFCVNNIRYYRAPNDGCRLVPD